MFDDLLYIEGQLEVLLASLPNDIPAEACSSLLGALLRVRRLSAHQALKTAPTGLLGPLEEALADLEFHTHGPTLENAFHASNRAAWYRAGMADGYRGALRYVEAAHQSMQTLTGQEVAHATAD